MSKDDGGPVYPNSKYIDLGISYRDWLAGLAMQGMAKSHRNTDGDFTTPPPDKVSKLAYEYADAMIARRNK